MSTCREVSLVFIHVTPGRGGGGGDDARTGVKKTVYLRSE